VRSARLWKRLLGVEHTVIEQVLYDEDAQAVVACVRPTSSRRRRCPQWDRRCPGYDQGEGRRRWRALDLGVIQAFLEADAPRVCCPIHGVAVAAVPWARLGAGFTRALEDTAAWLAVHTSRSAVGELLRVAWRTVGRVCARVAAEPAARTDRFAGLRRIGWTSWLTRRATAPSPWWSTTTPAGLSGPRPAATRPPWSGSSTPSATLAPAGAPTSAPTPPAGSPTWRRAAARRRSCAWIPSTAPEWATDALDVVRREVWNAARKGGDAVAAKELKGARFALWKNPQDLTRRQRATLARIAEVNRPLYRADLLKEELRLVFCVKGPHAVALLDAWLSWARRCRIPAFVQLARTVAAHRDGIVAALLHGLSNAGRVGQHQAAGPDPDGVRVPLTPGADWADDAQRRRAVPGSSRTRTTGPTDTSVDPDSWSPPVADACGAPVLRNQGPDRPARQSTLVVRAEASLAASAPSTGSGRFKVRKDQANKLGQATQGRDDGTVLVERKSRGHLAYVVNLLHSSPCWGANTKDFGVGLNMLRSMLKANLFGVWVGIGQFLRREAQSICRFNDPRR
jgi:transposase